MRDPSADALVRELNADLLTGRLFHLAPPEQGALVHTAVTACQAGRVVDAARTFITLHHGSGVPRFLACVEALAIYASGENDPWTAAAIYGLLFRYTADPTWEHRRQALLGQHPGRPPSARNAPRGPRPSMAPALGAGLAGTAPTTGIGPIPNATSGVSVPGFAAAPGFGAPYPPSSYPPSSYPSASYASPQYAPPSSAPPSSAPSSSAPVARAAPGRASTPPPRGEPATRLGLPPVRGPQAPPRPDLARAVAARPSAPGLYGASSAPSTGTAGPAVRGGWEPDLTPLPGARPALAYGAPLASPAQGSPSLASPPLGSLASVAQAPPTHPPSAHPSYGSGGYAPAQHAAAARPPYPPSAPHGPAVPRAPTTLHPDYGDVTPAFAAHLGPTFHGPAPWAMGTAPLVPAPTADAFELAVEQPVEHAAAREPVREAGALAPQAWTHEPPPPAPRAAWDAPSPPPTQRWGATYEGASTDDGVDDLLGSSTSPPPTRAASVDIPFAAPVEHDALEAISVLPCVSGDLASTAAADGFEPPPAPRLMDMIARAPAPRTLVHATQAPVAFEGLLGRDDEAPTERPSFAVADAMPPFEDVAPLNLPPLPDVFGASASPGPRRPR